MIKLNQGTSPSEDAGQPLPFSLRRRLLNLPNLVALALAIFLVYFLVARFDFDLAGAWSFQYWKDMKESSPAWYLAAFLVYYLIFPLRALRWRVLLEDSGGQRISAPARVSILRLAEISLVGWFVNAVTIFRMGFLYRCYALSRHLKSSFALVAGGLFAERILDTVVTFALLGMAALILMGAVDSPLVAIALIGGLLLSLAMSVVALAMAFGGERASRFLPSRFTTGYANFRTGTLSSLRRWPWLIALSLTIWACEALRLWFVARSLGLPVSLPMALFVALAASLVTSFPITPGGLGLVEAGMTGLLASVLTWQQALSVALLDRSINYLSVIVLGGLVFLMRSLSGAALGLRTKAGPRSPDSP